jgi:hypothetical protein
MPQTAIVTFTARPIDEILEHGGSRDWRLDAARARYFDYLVCTQNRHNPDFRTPTAPHRAAFLIGRIAGVIPSPERHDRWLIKIGEYIECNIPNIWGKSGHLRYPVWYTTLEELGIDLSKLAPFRPVIPPTGYKAVREMPAAPIIAPAKLAQTDPCQVEPQQDRPGDPSSAGGRHPWKRLDAILRQIDRLPDLAAPFDPPDWDEHGLPR